MNEPEWVIKPVVLALHWEQVAEHGGRSGVRDEALLDSALQRPKDKFYYERADLLKLAASYAFGLASNHPFHDGNKRVSLVTSELFLLLNGCSVEADRAEKVRTWLALASGALSEDALASWFLRHAI